MPELKLIYFEGCPNAKLAREQLILSKHTFEEVNQDELLPGHPMKRYSSPSILLGDTLLFGSVIEGEGGCTLELPSAQEINRRIQEASSPK